MVTMFIDTLSSPYYDKVVGNVTSSFVDLVVVGEWIELGIRRGNIGLAKKPTSKKKKGETYAVLVEPIFQQGKGNSPYPTQIHIGGSRPIVAYTNPPPTPYVPPYQPRTYVGVVVNSRPAQQNTRRAPKMLAPIPMTYIKLLPILLKERLLEIVPLKPLEPSYPRSYDPNAKCDYHGGAVGHATKRCWSLKHKDQGPNVQNKPLPAHRGMTINAISHENMDEGSQETEPVGASKRGGEEGETECTTNSAGWVEEGSHQSRSDHTETHLVAYVGGNGNPRPKPLIIHYNSASQPRVSFIIQGPPKSAYNNNIVPWRYPIGEKTPPAIKEAPTLEVMNIARTEGVTRSGRIFAPKGLRNKDLTLAKKDKAIEAPKRLVIEGEATEFLKLIRHSEYEMLDQLHKTPARVSLLSLLINSEGHRDLFLKVLNDAHVA
ncbi:hypothetical protein CR513_04004, partial [Mucuna pruriens]